MEVGAEAWGSELVSQVLGYLPAMSTEFARGWESNDMRAAIFKMLPGWIVLSVIAIHPAWRSYGPTVNSIYYRQGEGVPGSETRDVTHTDMQRLAP
ncbi:hypothetical protein FKM82_017865 [Ascaphus truei]